MSYVVLARKWRPQSFDDLVGQEHVSTTISNAIATGRVAHAFLFTGVRGVGKTTSARILAKALNCANGPSAKPCLTCGPCVDIAAGSDVDVQEIDGASYNGVDEVRRLQESLPYRPSRDRFKIFVVDEVHMLSNAAWNAFLKTLEEPPPHVKFIFATTEVHKVPITILSRCQRYDFKLISAQTVHARLRFVLDQEGVRAEDAAIAILAREAAGSMRDAMSLLDQVIAWVGEDAGGLTVEGVSRVLGVAARSVLHDLGRALIRGDAAACVQTVGALAEQGFDLPHVARDFLGHLRDLVVAKVSAEPGALLDLPEAEVRDVQALASDADVDDLARLYQGFSRSFDEIARSGQPRASLEMALVRLARRPPLLPVDDLLRRLTELEKRLGGAGGGGDGGSTGSRAGAGGGRTPAPSAAAPRRALSEPEPVVRSPAPASVERSMAVAQPPRQAHEPPSTHGAERVGASRQSAPHSTPAAIPEAPGPRPEPPPASPRVVTVAPQATEAKTPVPFPRAGAAALPSMPPMPPSEKLEPMRAVLAILRRVRPPAAAIFENAGIEAITSERVVLTFESRSFLANQATARAALDPLILACREHFGASPDVRVDIIDRPLEHATVAQIEAVERQTRLEAARRVVEAHPLVRAVVDLLGAEVRDVKLPPEMDVS